MGAAQARVFANNVQAQNCAPHFSLLDQCALSLPSGCSPCALRGPPGPPSVPPSRGGVCCRLMAGILPPAQTNHAFLHVFGPACPTGLLPLDGRWLRARAPPPGTLGRARGPTLGTLEPLCGHIFNPLRAASESVGTPTIHPPTRWPIFQEQFLKATVRPTCWPIFKKRFGKPQSGPMSSTPRQRFGNRRAFPHLEVH